VSYVFEHLELIETALKRPPFGLITDVDGTISPTAPTPQQAKVSRLCRQYLATLCHRLALVAAISGRPATEVRDMVGIDGMVYIGNHGLERLVKGRPEFPHNVQQYLTIIKSVIKELTPLLSIEGITIENKGVTATIHYRLCREPQLAEKEIMGAIKASPQASNLRIIKERMAIDLLPPIKMDKGTTILDLIQEYNLQSGIYLGDDVTDIDAFRAIHTAGRNFNFHGFAIGILSPEMPENLVAEVDFTLNGINDVERFLRWMSQQALESS